MIWFNAKKRKKMEFIQSYVPTSKAQLIQVAMYFNGGDLKKAQEMFDFYAKNLDLPDFDPIAPSLMQQVTSGASNLFEWVKANGGDLMQGFQIIQGLIQNKGVIPTVATAAEELPPIEE